MRTLLTCALLGVWMVKAHALTGIVTHVTDGDTVWVRPEHRHHGRDTEPVKVRLRDVDAPEICQTWGQEARAALASRVLHQTVWLHASATDTYGRKIGTLKLQGEDIAAWMVAEGHAWSDGHRQRKGGGYGAQERQARAARRGLFANADAVAPWKFRQLHGGCQATQ